MSFQNEKLRRLFFAGLGVVFVLAFGSLLVQVDGLIGSRGILPASEFLRTWADRVKGSALEHAFAHGQPTVLWINASDTMLHAVCAGGIACGVLLVLGFAPLVSTAACWLLYLSLVDVGQIFLQYQWDSLLLEVALFAFFYAPAGLRPWSGTPAPPSRASLWALRLLLFRFMFSSGAVKLLSDDPTWKDLTALHYHYFTQPLPTRLGWFAQQLPASLHAFSCRAMFVMELGTPWLVFMGRYGRRAFAAATIALMGGIAATGNYGFFEPLTVVLCLPVLADAPMNARTTAPATNRGARRVGDRLTLALRGLASFSTAALAALGLLLVAFQLSASSIGPPLLQRTQTRVRDAISNCDWFWSAMDLLAPWRSLNTYGLFAVMTTERPSIEIQGSDDQANWKTYEFRWKEGALDQPPRLCEPHMPRLDWQMWFAALRREPEPWFKRFLRRLLEGEPTVLELLASNPFPDRPPRFVRAIRFDYEFTTSAERAANGRWWKRRETGIYHPPAFLK